MSEISLSLLALFFLMPFLYTQKERRIEQELSPSVLEQIEKTVQFYERVPSVHLLTKFDLSLHQLASALHQLKGRVRLREKEGKTWVEVEPDQAFTKSNY